MRALDFVSPIRFGDELTAQAYMRRAQQALAKQPCRWAVAPDCAVLTPNGIRLGAGTEITLALMAGATPNAAQHIRRLVEQGYILEALDFDDGPSAA